VRKRRAYARCVARPLRICYPGAVYHVICRGNNREFIYRDDLDRESSLEILDHVVDRFSWLCHTYCLMGNHYHLLIETPRANLPIGMRQLNGLYAQYFNRRHRRCGHLFQARYASILVERDSHLLAVARYIVLNPVRAGLCTHPQHWPWSSYRAIAGTAPVPAFLHVETILSQFATRRRLAQHAYRSYIERGIDEALNVRGQRVGTNSFLRDTFGRDPPIREIPREQIEPLPPELKEIFATSPNPVATAYRRHGYTLQQIGQHLGRHYSTISRRLKHEETAMQDLTP
jgi:putative transposase